MERESESASVSNSLQRSNWIARYSFDGETSIPRRLHSRDRQVVGSLSLAFLFRLPAEPDYQVSIKVTEETAGTVIVARRPLRRNCKSRGTPRGFPRRERNRDIFADRPSAIV